MASLNDSPIRHWDGVYANGIDFTVLKNITLEKIARHVNNNESKYFLDIGCGTGQLVRYFSNNNFSSTGVDLSHVAIEKALANDLNGDYKQFDIEHDNLSEFPNKYDLIISKFVFAFIEDKPKFMESVCHLLAPGGVCAIISPTPDKVPAHKQGIAMEAEDIKKLVSQRLEIVEIIDIPAGVIVVARKKI